MVCDWWLVNLISFGCFCVSMFVAWDRNYDWRQRKTQFWGRLLNFRVRMFVKSAVKLCLQKSPQIIMASSPWWNLFWHRLDNSSGAFYVWRKALSNDLKELCPATKFIKKSNSWNRHQIEWNIEITAQNSKRRYKWHPPGGRELRIWNGWGCSSSRLGV